MAAASNVVGEVGLLVKPVDPNSQFNAGVKKIIDNIERNAQFQVKAAGLEQVQQQANGIANSFAQAAISAGAFTAAVYAGRAAIEGTIGKLQGLFDQLRQAQAGFSSILKSDRAGGQLLEEIREFARVSPFVTQELVNYSQQLLGVGLAAQKIVPLLEDVGNIVSSVGGDTQNIGRVLFTLTQIQTIGRLTGQDAMQLQSALIPVTKYLAEYLGKTTAEIKKLQEQGAISSETVFAAIAAQGEKVTGAMANATRNIGGARAVLSDTITITLQDQKVLNEINDDIYKGILQLANILGSEEFQDSADKFFEGVEKVYEGLKPLVESFLSIAGSGVLNGMGAFATVLGIIGDALKVINSVPGATQAIGLMLAGLAAIKTPLLLINYVTQLGRLSALVSTGAITNGLSRVAGGMTQVQRAAAAGTGVINANTAALERNSRAYRLGAFVGRNQMAIGAVAGAAGGAALSGVDNTAAQTAGGALTYGGIGLALGGPVGAAVGVSAGAFLAYTNKVEADALEHTKKMAQLGADSATSFLYSIKTTYEDGSAESQLAIRDRLETIQRETQRVKESLSGIEGGDSVTDSFFSGLPSIGVWGDNYNSENEQVLRDQLTQWEAQAEAIKAIEAEKFASISETLKAANIAPNARSMFFGTSPGGIEFLRDPKGLEASAEKLGITYQELASIGVDAFETLLTQYLAVYDAQKNATEQATKFNVAYKEAAGIAAAIFDGQQEQISSQLADIQAVQAGFEAADRAGRDMTDLTKQMTADRDALAAKEAAYRSTLAETGSQIRAAEQAERTYDAAIRARQESAGVNEQIRLATTKEQVDEMITLAGVLDSVENRDVVINFITQGLEEAKAALDDWRRRLIEINPNSANAAADSFEARMAAAGRGAFDPPKEDETAKKITDFIFERDREENERKALAEAERLKREAEAEAERLMREAEQWAASVESATESLTSALESAAEGIIAAAEAWTSSIKERTQYETAVSAGRLSRNADRQTSDLIELQSGLENLRARGITEEVLKALGIDNVADVRQVRKLVNSSDSDLSQLSASVTGLNQQSTELAQAEEDRRTRENIAEAIISAAKTLGIDKPSRDQATTLAAQFNITPGLNAEEIALAILNTLSAGRIGV